MLRLHQFCPTKDVIDVHSSLINSMQLYTLHAVLLLMFKEAVGYCIM